MAFTNKGELHEAKQTLQTLTQGSQCVHAFSALHVHVDVDFIWTAGFVQGLGFA